MKHFSSFLSLAALAAGTTSGSASELKAVDPVGFKALFPQGATIETLATDLGFTEGPVWLGGADGALIFSDIPKNQMMRWHPNQGLSVFREPSQKSNGNTLDLQGRLVTCEHAGRKVSMTQRDGKILPLVTAHADAKLNSPNDVVVRSDGTLWFTDPDYGLEGRAKEQEGNYVYRYDPLTDALTVVATDFVKPNGLCFSPDESMLYIADSGEPRHIRVFPVTDQGQLGKDRVFTKLDQGGPDGIRCDIEGRIWSSSGDGVQVFAPDGHLLARVLLPKGAANLCFGGTDGRTLFITAREGLYAVRTQTRDAADRRVWLSQKDHPVTSDWEPLFDANLSNALAPEGVWTVEEGVMTASEDQALWSDRDYESFILDLEFKNGSGANSGVVVHCTDMKDWIPNSVEIQVADDYADQWAKSPKTWQCGAIFGRQAASESMVHPAGEWNHMTVRCAGGQIDVVLNGGHVTSIDMGRWTSAKHNPNGSEIPPWLSKPMATLPTHGRIGLQGKHAGAPIWFRNVRIRELK